MGAFNVGEKWLPKTETHRKEVDPVESPNLCHFQDNSPIGTGRIKNWSVPVSIGERLPIIYR